MSDKANKETSTYPLSFGQKALYFLYLNSPESPAYNVAFNAKLISSLNESSLKKSFQKLVNAFPSLRTNFRIEDGKPVQEIKGYKEVFLKIINAENLDEQTLRKLVKQTNEIPFDLENGDLLKVYLFKLQENNYEMLMSMHHIITDGWSYGILFRELENLISAEAEGNDYLIPSISKKYSDYVNYQNEFISGDEGNRQWDYWKSELAGELPVLNLPADKKRPEVQTYNGSSIYFNPDKNVIETLRSIAQNEGTTLFVTLLAAYQILLHRYTSQTDIITGFPTAGRTQTEFDKITGYFINPVSLRVNFENDLTFPELLKQVKQKVLNAISNQDLPFSVIVERLLKKREPAYSPVFQTFFGLQKIEKSGELSKHEGKFYLEHFITPQQEGQFDLSTEFVEGNDSMYGVLKFNSDLFETSTIAKMTAHFSNLLKDISTNPRKKISEFNLLSDDEKNVLINQWNQTDFEFEKFDCVHKLFEEQSRMTPDSAAVIFKNEEISFDELNKRANSLANYLLKTGTGKDCLVGLFVERSVEMVVSILGILKAGAAYIPIDVSYPQSRIDYMIRDSGVKVLITQESLVNLLPQNVSGIILIDKDREEISKYSGSNPEIKIDLESPAYVIYTSGSTGNPKGVVIRHKSLSNHMLWMKDAFGFNSADRVLQKTPFSFDASVWEFYLPLVTGGCLVMAEPDGHMNTAYLCEVIKEKNVTIIQLVPSLLRLLLNENEFENCKNLKSVFCGGEALTSDLKEKLFDKLNVNFYNLYGPTEATIDATYFQCGNNFSGETIPIGKPVYNTQTYVVDKYMNLAPAGVAGELLIGGAGIAKGYLNNPELTNEKFIFDIFKKINSAKLYKTGDLVKYKSDGNLEFIGRADHQVKFRGFRIELEEIESHLSKHDDVKETVVIVREDNPGSQKLTSYVVLKKPEAVSQNDLKNYLRERLPEYMIPNVFVFMNNLPVLPNGKIDKKSLPVPDAMKLTESEFAAPVIPSEKILSEIWKEILNLEKVGVNDNFFELGGDSIISIQIISRANQHGIKITPKQIFQYQTIFELARVIEFSESTTGEQGMVTGEVFLTPVQHSFFESEQAETNNYSHSVLLKVPKNLNADFLEKSFNAIVKHHDALRLRFEKKNSGWVQRNDDFKNYKYFEALDLTSGSEKDEEARMEKIILEAQVSLNIGEGNLIKSVLLKTNDKDYDRLLIVIHHLAVDGISWRIILEDLFNSYTQIFNSGKAALPSKTVSFKEWSSELFHFANSAELLMESDYWSCICNSEVKRIPVDFDSKENTVDSEETVAIEVDEKLTMQLLKEVPAAYNTQINDVLLTALALAYNQWSDENKFKINLEGHGRENLFEKSDVSRTVGWFTSVFPVLIEINNPDDIGESIKIVKETLRKIPNNGIGYGMLKYLRSDKSVRDINSSNVPGIIFNYLGQFSEKINSNSGWKLGKRSIMLNQSKAGMRKHLLEINGIVHEGRLRFEFIFSRNIYKRTTIETLAENFKVALAKITGYCLSTTQGGFTPSDFEAAGLNQQELDNILSNLN